MIKAWKVLYKYLWDLYSIKKEGGSNADEQIK